MPTYYYRVHTGPVHVQQYAKMMHDLTSSWFNGVFPGTEHVHFRITADDLDTANVLAYGMCTSLKLGIPKFLRADHSGA